VPTTLQKIETLEEQTETFKKLLNDLNEISLSVTKVLQIADQLKACLQLLISARDILLDTKDSETTDELQERGENICVNSGESIEWAIIQLANRICGAFPSSETDKQYKEIKAIAENYIKLDQEQGKKQQAEAVNKSLASLFEQAPAELKSQLVGLPVMMFKPSTLEPIRIGTITGRVVTPNININNNLDTMELKEAPRLNK